MFGVGAEVIKAYISSLSRSKSGCTSATWSLAHMTFPSADNRSSILWILTSSGILFRRCCSSWSVVEVGTNSPFRFPAVSRPMIRVPAIVQWQIGITSWSSASKTLWKKEHVSKESRRKYERAPEAGERT